MESVFTLSGTPEPARPDLLRAALAQYPTPMNLDLGRHRSLSARFDGLSLGPVRLERFEISGADGQVTRAANSDSAIPAQLTVHILTAGSVDHVQNNRRARPRYGELVLSSNAFPFAMVQRHSCAQRTFTVPYDDLGIPSQTMRGMLTRPIGFAHPIGPVVSAHLMRLSSSAFEEPNADWEALGGPLIGMIKAALHTATGDESIARSPLALTLGDRIVEYLHANVTDPGLSAEQIAHAHSISIRYLYVVLSKRDITLGEWIREQRIERATQIFATASGDRPSSIASIAHRVGFSDHSHFTRTFKELRGMTPSQWRTHHADTQLHSDDTHL